jgi:hypothetical protein
MIASAVSFGGLDIESLPYLPTFSAEFRSSLAATAGVSTHDVTIVAITAGSVRVEAHTAFWTQQVGVQGGVAATFSSWSSRGACP